MPLTFFIIEIKIAISDRIVLTNIPFIKVKRTIWKQK